MRLAEKKLFSRDENDNSDIVQSSPKGKFVPFEKKITYIGIKTVEDINNMKENFEFSLKYRNLSVIGDKITIRPIKNGVIGRFPGKPQKRYLGFSI